MLWTLAEDRVKLGRRQGHEHVQQNNTRTDRADIQAYVAHAGHQIHLHEQMGGAEVRLREGPQIALSMARGCTMTDALGTRADPL